MYSQALEPSDFDWSETFEKNVKTEMLYSSSLLSNLPKTAMFFVESRPREEKKSVTFFTNNQNNVYSRYKTISYKINGKPVKYGLADMISANGTSFYSLMTDPDTYLENVNVNEYSSGFYVGDLEDTSLNVPEFKRAVETAGLISYVSEGRTWYRDQEGHNDIAFDNNNVILTKNHSTNSLVEEQYALVHDNIYRIIQSVRHVPMISAEGYCYEQKTTSTYKNYEFTVNEEYNRQNSQHNLITSDIKQSEDFIIIENFDNYVGGDLFIIDVLGRILYERVVDSDRINFNPSTPGVYILTIKKNDKLFSTKLYLN